MNDHMRQILRSVRKPDRGIGKASPAGEPADVRSVELPPAPEGEFSPDELNQQLNASDALNLSFLLSHRLERNERWRLMMDEMPTGDAMSELAARVSRRLEELSLRIADEKARAELGGGL